jgi:hypothetical protein
MNTIVGMWLFIACFGQSCTGAETRIVPGLTEGQCLHLREVYGHLDDHSETGKLLVLLQMIKRYGEAADQRRCAPHQLKGVGL